MNLSLESAVIHTPKPLEGPEARALAALVEEVEKRTRIRLPVVTEAPAGCAICLGRQLVDTGEECPAEGYAIRVEGEKVILSGNDARGVLYAVGGFLKTARMSRARLEFPQSFSITTAPRWPMRGHQLGYRPLPNSYTGWDVPQWDQYIRELALWGANAIELLPPRTGGATESNHFPLPRMEMMVEMARITASYGLEVWIWYPALDGDYSQPDLLQAATREWAEVFSKLCRVDAVFVPGGDPGDTPLHVLLPFLEKQTANLRQYHPQAAMWLSPQGFKGQEMDDFFRHLHEVSPDWLAGVVFGPWVHMDLKDFRDKVAALYPIRFYPDITHTRHCQYPLHDWDLAYALTQGREPTCPRPRDMANILRRQQPYTVGAICYSEGAHDDVNKALWSALSWNPEADVVDILREYARFFIGDRFADPFAQGLLALENNWRGPLLTNVSVYATLQSFRAMEDSADPHTLKNWRFLQPLFRAYCDAYTRQRLIRESALEDRSIDSLREAGFKGAATAMAEAEAILDQAVTAPSGRAWRTRIFQLAEALYQTIHHKLSVNLYHGLATGRGAHLDSLDWPLNSRLWLKDQFRIIRDLPDERSRLARLAEIVDRTDPGPGGFYDCPGVLPMTSRLERGPGAETDPSFIRSAMTGYLYLTLEPLALPYAWMSHAWTLNDAPLTMVYDDLDSSATYEVRVVYAMTEYKNKIQLMANDEHEVHGFIDKPEPVVPLSFDIPRDASKTGRLCLTWRREQGIGGEGQGCHITEIWLQRKDRADFAEAAKIKWEFSGQ